MQHRNAYGIASEPDGQMNPADFSEFDRIADQIDQDLA
jgi:hypothetical protein